MSAVDGVARLLDAAGVGTYSPDAVLPADAVPVTVMGMPASHGAAVTVATYGGGAEPDSRNRTEYPRLQVRVRHTDPLAALDLDRAAYDALQFTTGGNGPRALPGEAGWWLQDCYALQSEAQPLGRDESGRWEFVRNYQLTVQPPA